MSNFQLTFCYLLFFTIAACTFPQTQNAWEAVETTDNTAPIERHEAAFIKVKDKFYLLGGRGIKPVSIFDIESGSWSEGAAPPIEIHHFQPVVWEDKIYIMGAFTGGYPNETPIDSIIIYNPAIDQWSKGDSIPTHRLRGAAGVALHNDKIYMACGIKNGHIDDHKNWLDVYDPKTGVWDTLPDAPRARDHFQVVAANDRLYVIAGRLTQFGEKGFNLTIPEVDVYHLKSQTWETLSDTLPTLRAGNFTALLEREILVLGGESGTQVPAHSEVEALNLNTHKWSSLPAMIEGRHGTGAILHNNQLFVASGCGNRGGNPELKTMERLEF